jgi:predicted nucleotidyltransferase
MPPNPFFTPADRQQILDHLLADFATDARIVGVLVVGSGAVGFDDEHSDIDLAVVAASAAEVEPVASAWEQRIRECWTVRGHFSNTREPNLILHGFLLDNFLEIDIGFQHPDNLIARRERWLVAWDRTGQLADQMRTSWANRRASDRQGILQHHLDGSWYYITHVTVGVQRGQLWRALSDLDMLRAYAVELTGLRLGIETEHFRDVHQLPPDVLAELNTTLVTRLEPAEITRALRATAAFFFREARALSGEDGVSDLERSMTTYMNQET